MLLNWTVRLPMRTMALLLIVFGFTDALFTDIGLRMRLIEELNPLIRAIYEWNVWSYYGWKLAIPSILLLLLPRLQNKRWLCVLLLLTTIIYAAVNVYHLFWVSLAIHTL
ncbi:DUF5658 family protein [Paenibacillus aurantiacus]|uniref:DUF5658 family protein n=1 Tax=Paenibacillus aurantiacus TaxID=1936118 RepID=A0ABV5KVX1_9BACL